MSLAKVYFIDESKGVGINFHILVHYCCFAVEIFSYRKIP